jgi:hypothetical protein
VPQPQESQLDVP